MEHAMRLSEQTVAAAPSAAVLATRSMTDLGVQLQTFQAGWLEIPAAREHRLFVHASAPMRGLCLRQRFTYVRGDTDLVPAGMADGCQHEDAGTTLVLRLAPSLVQRAAEDMGFTTERAALQPRYQFRDPQIEHIAWALEVDRKAGHPSGRLYVDSLGLALAVRLLGPVPDRAPRREGLSRSQLERVTQYIEAHIDRDLSLSRLAEIAAISATQLKRGFRVSTGAPVHQYVVRRRVERARQLLLRADMPASEVALEAGFAHQSHMARCMRRVLGVTPRSLTRGNGALTG
jgi:AraC family transcriptional regulator